MAVQLSVAARNARLDAIETATGTSAILTLATGAPPANCAAAATGTILATMTLPSDWMAAASSGTKALSGTWQDTSADAAGTVAHYRIYASDGVTCHQQGTVTSVLVGTGDMLIDNAVLAAGQQVVVSSYTLTDANA